MPNNRQDAESNSRHNQQSSARGHASDRRGLSELPNDRRRKWESTANSNEYRPRKGSAGSGRTDARSHRTSHSSANTKRARRSDEYRFADDSEFARRSALNRQQSQDAPQFSKRSILIARIIALLILIVVAVSLVTLGSFALKTCSSQKNTDQGQTSLRQDSGQAVSEAVPTQASDGQIVMTLGGDENTVVLKGEEYLEAGCHAVDKDDGDITDGVQIAGEVNTDAPGSYIVTYTVTNSVNAQQTKTRTVRVVDTMDKDTDGISVLMYHYVYDDNNPPEKAKDDTNYLSQSKLKAQLKWLVKNDYYFPSYQELRAYVDGAHSLPKKSVVLTFDDAESGFLKYGIPVLEEYKVPATSFVICDRKAAKKNIKKYASEYVTFQSHSYTLHNDGNTNIGRGGRIYDLSEDELVEDLKKAAMFLGTNEAFAYPYGDVSDCAPSAMKIAGLLCAFTIDYDQVHPGDSPYTLSRIRVFGEGELSGYKYQVEHGKD